MSCESFCASPVSLPKNSAVPDLAIVPRWETASSRVRPMPLSRIETVPAFASASTQMVRSVSSPSSAGLASDRKRSLSLASEALEMSSRRKISRWLYSEWIMSLSSSRTSALNPRVSAPAAALAASFPGEASGATVSDMKSTPAGTNFRRSLGQERPNSRVQCPVPAGFGTRRASDEALRGRAPPTDHGVCQANREMAAITQQFIQLVPEQQQALHLDYFSLPGTSASQDWRTFSDQFL